MEQIQRIPAMEARFDRVLQEIRRLEAAIEALKGVSAEAETLRKYYQSAEWLEDFDADDEGRLPAGLKRGVLSQDGICNLLEDYYRFLNLLSEEGPNR